MNSRALLRGVCALASLAAPIWVLAQNASRPSVAAPVANTQGNVVIRNSPQGTAVYDDARGLAKLTKDVTITQSGEEFILHAQVVTYNRIKNQATATGDLRIETRDSTIKGGKMFADFNAKTIILSGNVVISAHGKGDGINGERGGFRAELGRKPVRIACNQVDWDYDIRQATLGGNVRMVQEDNVGTCQRIVYNEGTNIAQLRGKAVFGDSKKRKFIGRDLVVYIDQGKVTSKKPIQVVIPAQDSPVTPKTAPVRKTPSTVPLPPEISDEDLKNFPGTLKPLPETSDN